jgi:glycine/D-amino acid oxidase-like deaminating enzyme
MIRHHGTQGATRYLQATKQGLILQKALAKEIWQNEDNYSQYIKELGSYYVGYASDREEMQVEFETLKSLGCHDIEWFERMQLQDVKGLQSTNFECGIYFPQDAIIDSSRYAKDLLRHVLKNGNGSFHFQPNSTVQEILEDLDGIQVVLSSGERIRCNQLVVATGALFQDPKLNGLVQPCYSYLVHVPVPSQTNCDYSSNFFTWGLTHDWCFTNNKVRISGEDHFSAYKPPHMEQRCARLSKWTLQQYQCSLDDIDVAILPQQYGLYSETPDMLPLVGPLQDRGRICYLLGCNAWGQAIFSYVASLVPGILGHADLTEEQKEILDLVSIQRFEELPACKATIST